MRRVILPFVIAAAAVLAPARADALTLRDLVELSRAGLGDDVLLALIEVDRPVFSIDTETLKALKAAGVSERVMVAIVRSGRTQDPAPTAVVDAASVQPPAVEPQVIVIDRRDSEPEVREVAVPVAVPVYIPVGRSGRRGDGGHVNDGRGAAVDGRAGAAPVGRGGSLTDTPPPKRTEPVYWGWGGKRRPDAWKDKAPER